MARISSVGLSIAPVKRSMPCSTSSRWHRWDFDAEAPGQLPSDFINVLGDWQVQDGALAQRGSFGDPDFPRVIVRDLTFTNFTYRIRCMVDGGDTDRACGLLFRAQDSDNYLITRANALEGNLRFYRVVGGDRQQIASVDVAVSSGIWYELAVTMHGDAVTIRWNGAVALESTSDRFPRGKLGLWTKADSIVHFDDVEATAE